MAKDINDMFQKWYRDRTKVTYMEGALMNAYKECVLENENTIGDLNKLNKLTDAFQEILNEL